MEHFGNCLARLSGSWRLAVKRRLVIGGALMLLAAALMPAGPWWAAGASAGLIPDLQTVVPSQVSLNVRDGQLTLRFTNVIANMGDGVLQFRAVHSGGVTTAYQEILDASGNIVSSTPASTFTFHPMHNHWHIDGVADFSVRSGAVDGAVVAQSIKVTFCMIDTQRLLDKGVAGPLHYTGCNDELQGITNGWGDEYVRALPGQELLLGTSVPAGIYYLVSTSDPLDNFTELNDNNNTAWVKWQLSYVNGKPVYKELEHSPCTGALCGNR